MEGYDASRVAPKFKKPLDYIEIWKLLNEQPGSYDFMGNLDDIAGYDLVFLDFNDGTDDILRNVLVFQQALKWINDEKAKATNPQQTVILGMSMGGLVARYGLADITKNGSVTMWPNGTDTRLLISHDSPHQGANTPLGSQYLTRFLANGGTIAGLNLGEMEKIKQGNKLLDEPATEQLAIMKAITYNTFTRNTFLNNVYRPMVTFLPGDPTPSYKFIATASGSECGVQIFAPGTTLVSVNSAPLFYRPYIFRPPLLSISVNIKALPQQSAGAQNILSINTWASIRIFYSLINMNVLIQNVNSFSPSGELPWDGMPGGTREIRNELDGENIDIFPFTAAVPISLGFGWVQSLSYSAVEDFCFVPITSSLDITTVSYDALTGKYVGGISPGNPSRAANFIAQEGPFIPQGGGIAVYNNGHRFYTARNAEWMFKEMENMTPNDLNCSSSCQPSGLEVSGAGVLCNNPESYSVSNTPAGSSVTWSVSPGGIAALTQVNNTATLTTLSAGTVTLTASIPFCDGTVIRSKQVLVNAGGTNNLSVIRYMSSQNCVTPYAYDPSVNTFVISNFGGGTMPVEIQNVYGGLVYNNGAYSPSVTVTTPIFHLMQDPGIQAASIDIQLRVTNTCGWTNWETISIPVCEQGMFMFSVSPNPASGQLTVTLESSQAETAKTNSQKDPVIYRLYNFNMTSVVKTWQFDTNQTKRTLNIEGIKPGQYVLLVTKGQQRQTKQVIIR